ncbi:MAG TPA: MmcQ-like protein [Bacteroidales bacterium]|nr:MAG: MmcQ-like protein [Bacteroidetes bacterium GWE2_42_24]OFY29246.1 MAG: MmcQ-like protein [Bacteroidetes bacterium GWF2_43_11]HBZ66765.1 MmcQ-like protein [Bacteroidales bacterium]
MNIESFHNYCLQKAGATDSFPFDETTLVIKVMNKMFALTDLEDAFSISLKCDPDLAIRLREQYACVSPGYHMNKRLWNTVLIDGSVSDEIVMQWIDHSYELVVASLPKKVKDELRLISQKE